MKNGSRLLVGLLVVVGVVAAVVLGSPSLRLTFFGYPPLQDRLNRLRPALNWGNNDHCLETLAELGVQFTRLAPRAATSACGIDYGVRVSKIGNVRLVPVAAMTCIEAASLANWLKEVNANTSPDTPLTSLSHVGTYNCRPMRGQIMLSEHAYGNAIDIKAFGFANGQTIPVTAYDSAGASGTFLQAAAEAACDHFNAVITPRSGGLHADHFHLDRGVIPTCR